MTRSLMAACLALFSAATFAAPLPGNFEIRLGGGEFEQDDGSVNAYADLGNIQARVEAPVTDSVFFRGSYSGWAADEFEVNGAKFDNDLDFNVLRLGAGLRGGDGALRYFGALELLSEHDKLQGFDSSSDQGLVLSGGLHDSRQGSFLWQVELGLVALSDSGGAVFDWALGWRFTPAVALLLGGQAYSLEDDDEVETKVSTGTLGLQIAF